jgi:hypothetical protein
MSAEDDMAWPTGTTLLPADPPSPLTAEEIERMRARDREWSAMVPTDFLPTWSQERLADAYFVACLDRHWLLATLDAARAPDAGLRAAVETYLKALDGPGYTDTPPPSDWISEEEAEQRLRAALASSHAPAGLDVERLVREMRYDQNLSGRDPVYIAGWDAAVRILLDRLGLRAATRPAEDAGS